MKQYYFISGLPRSGSTLLSGILRQNPDFYADISSPLPDVVGATIDAISISHNNVLVGEEQRKNVIHGIFNGYYQHIERPVIFDSSRYWTQKTNTLQSLFPYTKILCPVRDIVSILNSFEIILSKNPFHTKILTTNNNNVFARCDEMMDKNVGNISKPWLHLKEAYALNPDMIHFIEYKNLCEDPEKTMRGVYEFLEKPYYSHDYENVEYSNEAFDSGVNMKDLHTIRRKVEYKPPRTVLPPEVVKKYNDMNMEFWRPNQKQSIDIDKLDYKFIEYN